MPTGTVPGSTYLTAFPESSSHAEAIPSPWRPGGYTAGFSAVTS